MRTLPPRQGSGLARSEESPSAGDLRLLRQSEDALADDVALDLGGAAPDRLGPGEEEERLEDADGVVAHRLAHAVHHLLLDRGVLGIDGAHAVRVSKHFIGHSDTAREVVARWNGAPLLEPQAGEPAPDDEHVHWHGDNVFREPARQPVR